MMEEMMDMSYADLNDLTNWHGGFQKLLSSAMCYEPEAHELFQDTVRKMRLVHGLEQESCITGVSEEVKNFCRESSNHNVHSNSEDGVSDTTTHDEQNNAGAASMAASHSLEAMFAEGEAGKKRKRRRLKVLKNSEEVESQRMTHIQVERNRRKQMNEYLSILRSLIPDSYIQRGDQASVIGGAIDLVKELEQMLQTLQLQKMKRDSEGRIPDNCLINPPESSARWSSKYVLDTCIRELRAENKSAVADIEVTLIESHASIKILSKKRPGQLLNIITALQSLNMTTLHLNITTIDQTIMFSFNIKIEEECRLNSANEIAAALQQILRMVHSDAIH
ncbi:transcription factor bHLH94 [Cryptomeria japonica]|uniref:transcription factor bHLH94 n=1 Tax=Cryptomeria japonica TaxID=3369 RepID=UPI0027DA8FD1|nr:transcription factor bHLH94 [Cryptomeria japonica]